MMQRKAYLCIRVDEVVISCWCRMERSALRCLSDGGLKEASGLANECHSGVDWLWGKEPLDRWVMSSIAKTNVYLSASLGIPRRIVAL